MKIRTILSGCLVLLCVELMGSVISYGKLPPDFNPNKVTVRPLVECHARRGLPNFYRKLESGQDVTIAYFGGSITAQNGYRVHSARYFQNQYPKSKIRSIHAAIGGTGSNLGAFRLEHDVLAYHPDLVFVEFAVNDGGAPPNRIMRSMEGIVRHLWREQPSCDILFVYTITTRHVNEMRAGKMSQAASVMENLADYYGIPSIHMGLEISRLEQAGKLIMKVKKEGVLRVAGKELDVSASSVVNTDGRIPVNADGKIPFAPDGVHPYSDTGHALYMAAIERSLPSIKKAGQQQTEPRQLLKTPIMTTCWDKVVTVPMDDPRIKKTGSWRKNDRKDAITGRFLHRVESFCTFEPGAELSFSFKGQTAALYVMLGRSGGWMEITLDNHKPFVRKLFTPYCAWDMVAPVMLCDQMNPKTVHTVRIKVKTEPLDKRSILFERNRPHFDKHPEQFKAMQLHAGCIYVIGEMVP